jgi:biopolymer transport protein ExbD
MSASGGKENGEADLTPILDMVFQLITFFMLVINFKGQSMDLTLKLPVLGSARPLDYHGRQEPMLLNINSEGRVQALGQSVDVEPYVEKEARVLKMMLKGSDALGADGTLPVPVIIRADKAVTFAKLNQVIRTCQAQGYREFSLSAMNREEGP